jgi:tetratricopeptide (TPR) repeat protein
VIPFRWRGVAAALLVVTVGAVAYSNTFAVPFQFDDLVVITAEPSITAFHPSLLSRRFLGDLSFALSYRWFGERTAGYHVVNLLVHLANALLVLRLVRQLWRTDPLRESTWSGRAEPIALLAALLFVAHPMQTQAVTYIVQRYASLAAMFFLASVSSYVAFRLAKAWGVALGWYAAFLAAAVAACWTKENAVVLPLAVVAVEWSFFEAPLRRRALWFSPFLAAGALAVVAALASGLTLTRLDAMTRVDTDMPRADYFLTQLRVVATYLRLLVLPVGQNLDPDVAISRSLAEPGVLLAGGLHLALLAGTVLALRRGLRGDGAWRLVGFGGVWFYVTLLVESSFIPIVDVAYEHRVYLPSFGPFLAFAAMMAGAPALRPTRRFLAVAALLVAVLTGATLARNRVWRSPLALWSDVVAKSPHKPRPINNLGIAVMDQGDLPGAAALFERALREDPSYAKAYFNLGEARQKAGDCEQAIPPFEHFALQHPGYPDTWRNLADCYERTGRSAEARMARDAFVRVQAERRGRALENFYR